MKNKISIAIILTFIIAIITFACNKNSTTKLEPLEKYNVIAMRSAIAGVSEIFIDYNKLSRSATIRFNAQPKIVLGFAMDLSKVSLSVKFAPDETLEKITVNEHGSMFSITDKEISYSYKNEAIKTISLESLRNKTLDLTEQEKVLAVMFTALHEDLLSFTSKNTTTNSSSNAIIKQKEAYAKLEVGCYQIGGSESAVQQRLNACTRKGCSLVGTDVSCLFGKHACFGTATFSCGGPPYYDTLGWDDIPHIFA